MIAEIREAVDAYPDRVLVGEIYLPLERLVAYYGTDGRGVQMPFNFQLIQAPWNAREIGRIIREYERLVPGEHWPNWVLGNHDKPRIASRVGLAQARVAAMMLLTLRGTPTLYYGDEIGMEDVAIAPEDVRDPWEKNEPGLGLGRDPQRTPMQWDASPNAGFTTGRPWLPVGPDHAERNVRTMAADPRSILTLHRRLIALRRGHAALAVGAKSLIACPDSLIAFERRHGEEAILVVLNLGHAAERVGLEHRRGRVLLSTHLDREDEPVAGELPLRADEGVVILLDAQARRS